ncbi:unnamed protein product [Urochloa humidicola]
MSQAGGMRARSASAARTGATSDEAPERNLTVKEEGEEDEKDDAPLLPLLDKKALREFIVPLSTAALLGITAINVLTSTQGQDPSAKDAKHKAIRKFLVAMPYSLYSAGLAGLAAAMAATRRPRVLGCAAGYLLGELVFLVVMGALVTIARCDVDNDIVWPATGGILILIMLIWPMMCAYPKCLRRAFEWVFYCFAKPQIPATDTQQKCKTCGAFVVNGKFPNPAAAGAVPVQPHQK